MKQHILFIVILTICITLLVLISHSLLHSEDKYLSICRAGFAHIQGLDVNVQFVVIADGDLISCKEPYKLLIK